MSHLLVMLFIIATVSLAHAADPQVGKAKFDGLCATCHGPTGAGDGPAAAALNPKPANLSQTKLTDDQLKKIIKDGGASVGRSPMMAAWGATLSDVDIDHVIAYIRTFKK